MLGERFLTERDKEVFGEGGYGGNFELGSRPLFLIIDVTYEFTGPVREPILDAVKKSRTACGEEGWLAVDCISRLLPVARAVGIPIIYTKMDRTVKGPFAKKKRGAERVMPEWWAGIAAEIKPVAGDAVIAKVAPSAFFGTSLPYLLIAGRIDTVVVAGGTTSGCVRASVTDAFSYGYKTAVIREGTFDRGEASGEMSLFDMNAKYARVISEKEAKDYFESFGPGCEAAPDPDSRAKP